MNEKDLIILAASNIFAAEYARRWDEYTRSRDLPTEKSMMLNALRLAKQLVKRAKEEE